MTYRWLGAFLAAALVVGVAGPGIQAGPAPQKLILGMVPSREIGRMMENLGPLSKMLSDRIGIPIEPFVATNFTGLVEAMGTGRADIGIFGPFALVLAEERHKVVIIAKSIRRTRGHFVTSYHAAINVRADSPFRTIADLKGRRFAFVDPASTSGYLFPYMMLLEAGINPERDLRTIFAGSHDAAVVAVYKRDVDASATHDNAIPDIRRELPDAEQVVRILVRSSPIPNDGVAVRRGLPEDLVAKIQAAFVDLGKHPGGVQVLEALYNVVGYAKSDGSEFEIIRKTYSVMRDKIRI
ncbi:MAG: phosphate/phosphite/phosphonate ABC transporter substrate-binding protein [Armatimonadota bacterium]|nr:phosphate/phosphite/phosphonate ABC transporter substrate-binding protein [Armatimonadota bacterium]MDR7550751.1 phosphate/phosphite/phosphonate ABC transporter substrate-binding protein [Armatimonadota bacterium]